MRFRYKRFSGKGGVPRDLTGWRVPVTRPNAAPRLITEKPDSLAGLARLPESRASVKGALYAENKAAKR
ncbi:MAG: hypothetical protein HY661_03895 [Betaproteobacteria bacterium]|nr:hypothetical protein [Betaproteobacteria bacterium]